jgi:rubrerythrin
MRFDPTAWLGSLVLSRLVATPRGRAFLLSFMADAEEADEGAFDRLIARVDAPELQKMVRIHKADEERHARVLREALARQGAAAPPLPAHLRIVDRIDAAAGGAFRLGFPDDPPRAGVMKVYALLQAVEERGVAQFPSIARAIAPHDPRAAAAIEDITRDEARHVLYAQAIARRYADDETAYQGALAWARAIEQRAFDDHGRAFTEHVLASGLAGAAPRAIFRAITGVARATS